MSIDLRKINRILKKVNYFWEGHKNLKKSSISFWRYLVALKKSEWFLQILWASQNIGTLCTYQDRFWQVQV